uniref:Ubiquitin-like protease family profile domain-containing protein n=1 Tax=Lactuca sativa TaxID=4236 RepID=A0A9R1VPL7_LACSA|nr:hypothetical protein LSAT_V11C400191730 [Lactuca sativa]
MTAMMADGQVTKIASIKVQSENDLFGYDSQTYLTWDDFEAVLTMDDLTGVVIVSSMIHWVLGVLDLKSDTCYYLDSLSSGNFNM